MDIASRSLPGVVYYNCNMSYHQPHIGEAGRKLSLQSINLDRQYGGLVKTALGDLISLPSGWDVLRYPSGKITPVK